MEQDTVCQPGQRIMIRHMGNLGFHEPLFSDVVQHDEPAFLLHGGVMHRQRPVVREIQNLRSAFAQ